MRLRQRMRSELLHFTLESLLASKFNIFLRRTITTHVVNSKSTKPPIITVLIIITLLLLIMVTILIMVIMVIMVIMFRLLLLLLGAGWVSGQKRVQGDISEQKISQVYHV